jgi:N-acetylglucosamine-6-phosphate deacetylase
MLDDLGDTMRLTGRDPESGVIRQVDAGPGAGRREAGWLAKAFCDLQINGFAGVDFNSPGVGTSDYRKAAHALWTTGVTRFCPTIITADHDSMCRCLEAAAAAAADPLVGPSIAGIHVEGPYISPEDGPRGAHPREAVRPPDRAEFERLQQAAGGRIRLVTLAPETRDAPAFIAWLCTQGIVVAIGHTAADARQIAAAVDAGARLSTHLGNGAAELIHRHHNIIWEQLAADSLAASFIVDGHHLPPSMVKAMVRSKGVARSLLVTDAVAPAGCPPGVYRLGSQEVELTAEGKVHLRGGSRLAGSALRMDAAVANVMQFAGVTLAEALRMAGPQPAALLGREFPSDYVLLDHLDQGDGDRLRVRAAVREGELLWTDSSATART